MTPLGHLAVSYSLGRTRPLSVPYAVIGGVAPDLDFTLVTLASFNTLHRSLTHNLFFVGVVALLCALLARSRASNAFASAFLGGVGHLFVDAVLDSNPSNGIGVAALWPLSGAFFSPFNLTAELCPGWDDPLAALRCNLPLAFWELPFYLLAALLWIERRNAAERE